MRRFMKKDILLDKANPGAKAETSAGPPKTVVVVEVKTISIEPYLKESAAKTLDNPPRFPKLRVSGGKAGR